MHPPSIYDTPPDGDFARYVEELGQSASVRLPAGPAPGAQDVPVRSPRPGRASQRAPADGAAAMSAPARVRAQLAQLFQWGFAAVVVFLLVTALFPQLSVIAVPLLLAFGALAWLRLRQLPWKTLMADARKSAGLPSTDPGARDRARPPP